MYDFESLFNKIMLLEKKYNCFMHLQSLKSGVFSNIEYDLVELFDQMNCKHIPDECDARCNWWVIISLCLPSKLSSETYSCTSCALKGQTFISLKNRLFTLMVKFLKIALKVHVGFTKKKDTR